MKVFVSGGAGFIGSHLTDALRHRGDSVTVYDNLSTGRIDLIRHHLGDPAFRFVEDDLLNADRLAAEVKGHALVVHLASNADIAASVDRPEIEMDGIRGTFNLLDAMRTGGVKRIVYLSGSGVYGESGPGPFSEAFGPLLPISLYGASKLAGEGLISAFSHFYDFQAWIMRPANIVGPRQTHGVILDFVRNLRRDPDRLDILGDGRQSKSYLHVEDLLEALFLVLERARERVNLFNVASDDTITVSEIASIVTRTMGLECVELRFAGGARGWKGDVPRLRFDLDRIRGLGWRARHRSARAVERAARELLEEG